jgi:carbon storage regulator
MLVLSRKERESIIIDERIVITVIDLGRGRVRLGIEAPKEVPVVRSELRQADRRAAENAERPQEPVCCLVGD